MRVIDTSGLRSFRIPIGGRAGTEIIHRRFVDLGDALDAGDLLVVNTSAVVPAALDARGSDGNGQRLHLSTEQPGGFWVVEPRHPAGPGTERYVGTPPAHLVLPGGGRAEMPSAARPFTESLVTELVTRGIVLAPITLHTGVSSQEAGEPPYAERYEVPGATASLVNAAHADGHRVIAVGTTVVRALESTADEAGRSHPGRGWTELVVTPDRGVRVVDGLVTGWHEPESSHLAMLESIAGRHLLDASYAAAVDEGYRWHEFGDSHLILP